MQPTANRAISASAASKECWIARVIIPQPTFPSNIAKGGIVWVQHSEIEVPGQQRADITALAYR